MIDLIKKTLLAGVGAAVVTVEKVEARLEEWVKQGKISAQEAKDTAQRIVDEGRKEWETASTDLSARVKELLARANLVPRSEFEALAARVAALEARLGVSPAAAPAPAEPPAPASPPAA